MSENHGVGSKILVLSEDEEFGGDIVSAVEETDTWARAEYIDTPTSVFTEGKNDDISGAIVNWYVTNSRAIIDAMHTGFNDVFIVLLYVGIALSFIYALLSIFSSFYNKSSSYDDISDDDVARFGYMTKDSNGQQTRETLTALIALRGSTASRRTAQPSCEG